MNRSELWREKLDLAVEDFQQRRISDDVFRALLYSAGFRGTTLSEEFNFQAAIRYDIEKCTTLDGRLQKPAI